MPPSLQTDLTGPHFGRQERTEIRPHFDKDVLVNLREAYLADDRPWVIGFSGGKDSTCVLQLTYYMLARLPRADLRKPVYVLASDTRVETPAITSRLRRELELISASARRDGLPITTHLVFPQLNDTFWVNLIGRGYPSPNRHFRWCTDRLKITPVSRFIKELVDRTGAVVVVLGARKDESSTRAQTMAASKIEGQRFRPHADLPRAWVFTPIEELSANEVWTYLMQVPSPWSGDTSGLVTLYKAASGGSECPLVIDTSTPSCGQSRFGCWTCTVVDRDKSMEALVEGGDERLEPLLELRDYLKEVRSAAGARMDTRRNGALPFNRAGEQMFGTGPFTFESRREILRRVLLAQKESGHVLIEGDELAAIQEIWSHEEEKQPRDVVSRVWSHVYEEKAMPNQHTEEGLGAEDALLREVCEQAGVSFEMMRELRDVEERFGHLKRRQGLPDEMREIVRQASKSKEA